MQVLLDVPNPNNNLTSLRTFHDTIESHSCGLATLGVKQNLARSSTRREWTFSQQRSAILREIETLETGIINSQKSPITAAFLVDSKPPRDNEPHDKGPQLCVFCKGSHTANQCTTTDHHRRLEIVKQNNLCFN